MKPKTLARIALKNIEKGIYVFDSEQRKIEALRVIEDVLHGKPDINNDNLQDPIIEFNIGVYVPNFDYPIIPVDSTGEPIIWDEDDTNFVVPGNGTHIFRGIGLSGEKYYMGYLKSLAPFRETIVKVDRYTNLEFAAYAFLCTMTRIIDKDYALDHMVEDYALKIEYDVLLDHWKEFSKVDNIKEFENNQKHLYIKWLQKWICRYGTNPDAHMKILRFPKKEEIEI